MDAFMKLLFGRKEQSVATIEEPVNETTVLVPSPVPVPRKSSQQKLVEEIHNEFDTAPDRLIREANELLESIKMVPHNLPPLPEGFQAKANRLQKLGFVNAIENKEVQARNYVTEQINKENEALKKKKEEAKKFAELVLYYQRTYPFCKFLSNDELDRICLKYGLIHAPVGRYIKTVPDKNIAEIENAQPLKISDMEKDVLVERQVGGFRIFMPIFNNEEVDRGNVVSADTVITRFKITDAPKFHGETEESLREFVSKNNHFYGGAYGALGSNRFEMEFGRTTVDFIEPSPFYIAAPKDHFDLKGYYLSSKFGYTKTIVTEDPIVFRKVRGGILCVSKWGLESEDPALLNPINN